MKKIIVLICMLCAMSFAGKKDQWYMDTVIVTNDSIIVKDHRLTVNGKPITDKNTYEYSRFAIDKKTGNCSFYAERRYLSTKNKRKEYVSEKEFSLIGKTFKKHITKTYDSYDVLINTDVWDLNCEGIWPGIREHIEEAKDTRIYHE